MSTLRIGIVGCGGIARAHLAAYRTLPGVTVAAVFDLSPVAAEALAREAGATAVPTLEAMASMGLDAVSICTPPGARIACCSPFFQRGIAVLCEKPLGADERSARELVALARASTSIVMTAFCHRFHGPLIELRKLVASGRLGAPVLMRTIFTALFPLIGNHRSDPTLAGGGCLMDNGTHAVDCFRFIMGDVAEVQAMMGNAVQHTAVEDVGLLALRSTTGCLGEVTTSFSTPVGSNWIEWYGSEVTARLSYWNAGHPDLAWCLKGSETWTPIDCSAHPGRFEGQLAHFVSCVRSKSQPSPSIEDGLAASIVLEAAYSSARSGARVAIATTKGAAAMSHAR